MDNADNLLTGIRQSSTNPFIQLWSRAKVGLVK
jgi:hypothetical protein